MKQLERITINTIEGQLPIEKVNPADITEYSFIGDERRQYTIQGKEVVTNRFKKAINELSKIKF